jgi:ketosteroid isomerase-like protein
VSDDNLSRLRDVYARWERGDFATGEIFHPDVVTEWDSRMPVTTHNVGVEALARTLFELLAEFDEFRFEALEFIEGPKAILVAGRLHGTGARSGADVTSHFHHAWTFRDGLAVRLEGFFERAPALRVAGLEPEGPQ